MDSVERFAHGNLFQRLGFVVQNRLFRRNSIAGSKRNIESHYDVGNDFYRLWLDETMTYSSALYDGRDADLANAQRRKYDRILDRIDDEVNSMLSA